LQEVERYSQEGVTKTLVGCKCDLISERTVSQADAQDFADSLSLLFFETSAKNTTSMILNF
jgi:Ras-related protein Rab-1A